MLIARVDGSLLGGADQFQGRGAVLADHIIRAGRGAGADMRRGGKRQRSAVRGEAQVIRQADAIHECGAG